MHDGVLCITCRNLALLLVVQGPGPPAGEMPGPWVYLKENPDFYDDLEVKKGEYIESHVFDQDGNPQGQVLWVTRSVGAKAKEGIWLECRLVAVLGSSPQMVVERRRWEGLRSGLWPTPLHQREGRV